MAPATRRLVVFLHGIGSHGGDLAPLADTWQAALPGTAFAAPDAPFRFDHGPGYQWFSLDGITEANRPERLAAARAAFDRVLTGIVERHGLTGSLDRVALVGFSQGSIMALDAVASGRWPVGAAIAFSGRLVTTTPLTPALGTPLLLVHGAADPVIPASETTHAATLLAARGVTVESHILPGIGHTISAEGVSLAERFLVERWGR